MTRISLAVLMLSLSIPVCALAADAPSKELFKGGFQYNDMGATPPKDDSLYQALGGKDGITAFTKEFVVLLAKDDRIGHFFADTNLDRFGRMLTNQFIELSGGPVTYNGQNMDEVHRSLGITNADFNRLVEDLQVAMDHHDVSFSTQNRLLALLASMQRAVVTQ